MSQQPVSYDIFVKTLANAATAIDAANAKVANLSKIADEAFDLLWLAMEQADDVFERNRHGAQAARLKIQQAMELLRKIP